MDEATDRENPDLKIGDLSLGSETAITEAKTDVQAAVVARSRGVIFDSYF